jgi:hypothetical protein
MDSDSEADAFGILPDTIYDFKIDKILKHKLDKDQKYLFKCSINVFLIG